MYSKKGKNYFANYESLDTPRFARHSGRTVRGENRFMHCIAYLIYFPTSSSRYFKLIQGIYHTKIRQYYKP